MLQTLAAQPVIARAAGQAPAGDAVALLQLAESLAGRALAAARPIPWICQAIGEAARDLSAEYAGSTGPSWANAAKTVARYADRARAPAPEGSTVARSPPRGQDRSTLQRPAEAGEHDWSTGARAPTEF